jgi:hypothetical protein
LATTCIPWTPTVKSSTTKQIVDDNDYRHLVDDYRHLFDDYRHPDDDYMHPVDDYSQIVDDNPLAGPEPEIGGNCQSQKLVTILPTQQSTSFGMNMIICLVGALRKLSTLELRGTLGFFWGCINVV